MEESPRRIETTGHTRILNFISTSMMMMRVEKNPNQRTKDEELCAALRPAYRTNPSMSYQDVADSVGLAKSTVHDKIKKHDS